MRKNTVPALLGFLLVAGGASASAESVWDLTSHLTLAQWAVNYAVFEEVPPDSCDAENRFDPVARRLADEATAADLQALRDLEQKGSREQQAAACRAVFHLARDAWRQGDKPTAADFARHVYLSGCPDRLRFEALRIFCATAPPEEARHRLDLIAAGRADAIFQPALDELRLAVADPDGC